MLGFNFLIQVLVESQSQSGPEYPMQTPYVLKLFSRSLILFLQLSLIFILSACYGPIKGVTGQGSSSVSSTTSSSNNGTSGSGSGSSNTTNINATSLQGTPISSEVPNQQSQILKFDGTNWKPTLLNLNDLKSNTTGASVWPSTPCTLSQTLSYNTVSDVFECVNLSSTIDSSAINVNLFLPSQNSHAGHLLTTNGSQLSWADINATMGSYTWTITSGTNLIYLGGLVGMGYGSPTSQLDVGTAINIKGINAIQLPTTETTLGASIAIGKNALKGQTSNGNYNNIAIGSGAMETGVLTTAATNNLAIGKNVLKNLTTGSDNIGIGGYENGFGRNTLQGLTTGSRNIAVGNGAASFLVGDNDNIAIGHRAMAIYTTGSGSHSNIAIGGLISNAGYLASRNIGIGSGAGYASTGTLSDNVYIGYQSARNHGGIENTFFGSESGYFSGGGQLLSNSNVILGRYTGAGINSSENVIVGHYSFFYNGGGGSTGDRNTIVGASACSTNVSKTGDLNVVFGYNAFEGLSSGQSNVILGANVASTTLTSGTGNILIGNTNKIDTPSANTSYFLNISNIIFGTNLKNGTLASPAGDIGIGTSTPTAKLDVNGSINLSSTGTLSFGGSSVCTQSGCVNASDENLKTNIQSLDPELSLNQLSQIQGVSFEFKDKEKFGEGVHLGFIAQDVEAIFPEVVKINSVSKSPSLSQTQAQIQSHSQSNSYSYSYSQSQSQFQSQLKLKSIALHQLIAPIIESIKALAMKFEQIKNILETKVKKLERRETLYQQRLKIQSEQHSIKNQILKLENHLSDNGQIDTQF